jgi:4-amino-4-deoxy-L-arabinose transferase-like glycosyltransferase
MKTHTAHYYIRLAWLLVGLGTIFRLVYGHAFLLSPDETNYWQWSRYLDWGYYDQAPLIAWAIRLTTSILGQTELAVRLPSIISMTVASIYLVLIAHRWFSSRVAFHTALISQTVFIFTVGGLLATADGLQGAAWAAVSYHIADAMQRNRWRSWLLGGVWLGIGMLAKYTMVLMPLGVLLFACFSTGHRQILRSIRPYAACAVGMLMFSPVIVWNAAHQWGSVRHVAYIGGANQSFRLHFNLLLEFLASQIGLLSPLVFLLIILSWYRIIRRRYPAEQWIFLFLFFTSFPMVGGFGLLSLHTRVYGNWPCFGYVTAIVLATAFWSLPEHSVDTAAKVKKIWIWTVSSSFAITALALTQALWPILPIPLKYDRAAHEIIGWDHLGRSVAAVQSEMPHPGNAFIFGLSYQIASELAFYTPGNPFTVAINRWNRPNVYDYWWKDQDLIGRDGVGVIGDRRSRDRLLQVFDRVDPPIPVPIRRNAGQEKAGESAHTVTVHYIYRCYGFKGGLRWIPRRADDIRAGINRY